MDNMQQDPNSALGQIQKLMGSMAQNYDPAERQQALQRQETAQASYNQVLNQPLPDQGPISRMVGEYLMRYGSDPRKRSWDAAAVSIGGEGQRSQDMEQSQLMRQQKAAAEEARMAGDAVRETDQFSGRFMASMGRAGAGAGKPPSPEVLRTVYNAAFNTASQTAKEGQFGSPDERMAWIREQANTAVQDYVQNFATQPTGPRGIEQAQPQTPQQGAPQTPPQQGLSTQLSVPPGGDQNAMINQLRAATATAQNPETSQAGMAQLQALRQQFPQAAPTPQQQQTAEMPGGGANGFQPAGMQQQSNQPSQPTMRVESTQPPANVLFRNKPAEAAAKKGAEGMAESYVDDYKTVLQAAQSAEAQKQAFDNLAKIKPETNALANTAQTIGSLFSALGQDPSSPMIQNAIKTRDANLIISQLTNAGLRAEKGVQTKSDEVRVANEFPKTTDFQQVWNFSIKLGQERAQRMLDQRDFFDSVAEANNGSPTRARQLWNKEMTSDPLTQYLGNKLIFRNDFIKAYEAKHPELGRNAAVQVWREMEQDYQKRGGKK